MKILFLKVNGCIFLTVLTWGMSAVSFIKLENYVNQVCIFILVNPDILFMVSFFFFLLFIRDCYVIN